TVPYTTPFRSADLVQHPACQLVQYRVITGERRLRTRPVHHQVGETQLLRALGGLPESGHARQGIGRAGIGVEVPANVPRVAPRLVQRVVEGGRELGDAPPPFLDRKSTRLNSSHVKISYAVSCLKKKTHASI